MVYTLPDKYAPHASFGNQFFPALTEAFQKTAVPAAQKEYQRGQLQKALGQLRSQGQNPNASPTDLLYNLIEASGYAPEIGRNLPQLFQQLNMAREAEAMKNFSYTQGQQPPSPGQQPFSQGQISPQNQMNPQVESALRQSPQRFPTNISPQEKPGNLPQEATQGQVRPILSGDQLLEKARIRQQQLKGLGIIKPLEEVYSQVVNENEQNQVYNKAVELEREKRVKSQEHYGQIAADSLTKVYPEAADEELSVFMKKGEEIAGNSKSEAANKLFLSKEASKFKNAISNVEKTLQAPRIQNVLQRRVQGNRSSMDQVMKDATSAIQPLLREGLYEKSRTLLANSGFYPEEREKIVFGDIPEYVQEKINTLPKATLERPKSSVALTNVGAFPKSGEQQYSLKNKMDLFKNLKDVFGKENPDVNLILLRKQYEEKNYDWRIFKDALNDMVQGGLIKLTDDQTNQLNSDLNKAPLTHLEKILYKIGFIGR